MPALFLCSELFFAGGSQRIGADATAAFALDPFGADPSRFFHAMEGRIEGAFFEPENVIRGFADGRHDRVAMQAGAAVQEFQDEEIEGALESIRPGHT